MEMKIGTSIDFSSNEWMHQTPGDDPFAQQIYACAISWVNSESHVAIATSGTTGERKTMHVPKEWIRQSAQRTMEALGLSVGFSSHLCLPLDFIAGKMVVWRAIIGGGHLTWEQPSSFPMGNMQQIVDTASITPHQLQSALPYFRGKAWPVRHLLIGGGPMSENLRTELSSQPLSSYETFGMAETLSHIALKRLHLGEQRFKAVRDVIIECDERLCLRIGIPYFDHLEVQTNDMVDIDADGTFAWCGRADWVINSGGVKLFPESIEERIHHLISIPFAVHGVADALLGSKAVLFMESVPWDEEQIVDLMANIKSILPPLECPREIRFMTHFERTASGKIKRQFLL